MSEAEPDGSGWPAATASKPDNTPAAEEVDNRIRLSRPESADRSDASGTALSLGQFPLSDEGDAMPLERLCLSQPDDGIAVQHEVHGHSAEVPVHLGSGLSHRFDKQGQAR